MSTSRDDFSDDIDQLLRSLTPDQKAQVFDPHRMPGFDRIISEKPIYPVLPRRPTTPIWRWSAIAAAVLVTAASITCVVLISNNRGPIPIPGPVIAQSKQIQVTVTNHHLGNAPSNDRLNVSVKVVAPGYWTVVQLAPDNSFEVTPQEPESQNHVEVQPSYPIPFPVFLPQRLPKCLLVVVTDGRSVKDIQRTVAEGKIRFPTTNDIEAWLVQVRGIFKESGVNATTCEAVILKPR